ncbi:MAG: CRISPR-associated ring nuclease Csm6 [Syntrophales bacterium]|nr:CRISPR-associated ring nuclease Csm6 [Syntrophales bacterium]
MRNILLAVLGLTPQVITETLYALYQEGRHVDSIHVITTRKGKEKINAHLLAPGDGWFYRFLREYEVGGIEFSHDNIHTVKDEYGNEYEDIEDAEANEALLKLCLEITFHLTRDPDTAVFFSIAGGRKTMSACLMVAAQCYGRPQDRIYHVLVSSEYESNPDFFYPPRKSIPVRLIDSKGHEYAKETKYAEIKMVSIPFFSFRHLLSGEMLKVPRTPAELMLSVVRDNKPDLIIDLSQSKVIYKGRECDLMPARMVFYAFFALRKKNCPKGNERPCKGCNDCYVEWSALSSSFKDEIVRLYRRCNPKRAVEEMKKGGILDLDMGNFNAYKGKIRRDLEAAFGAHNAKSLIITGVGKKPDTRYGIPIDRNRIKIIY